ncbi:MAG: hypothetical protein QNJ42_09405 [Crocosphaera sp.]|nr:hypothetical protein [Crocosphaera sp.]
MSDSTVIIKSDRKPKNQIIKIMNIGVLGIGLMGKLLAERLLQPLGAKIAQTSLEAIQTADILILTPLARNPRLRNENRGGATQSLRQESQDRIFVID